MADQGARLDLRRKVEGPLRIAQPLVALPRILRGGLENIGGSLCEARGQRTKVVDRTHLDDPLLQGLEYPGNERDANPVAELHVPETEIRHLAKHGAPVRVAMRAP